MQAYKYREYQFVTGNTSRSSALCVVWQDTARIVEHFPQLKEAFCLIGNLRSAFGINILLYNLALNPHITELVVWGPDRLSNTPIGVAGKQTLIDLWNGIGKEKLVEQIDPAVLDTILSNVTLREVSDRPVLDAAEFTRKPDKPYMKPHAFPELKIKAPDTLPSERYTYPLREQTGAEAYVSLLHMVWKYGSTTKIDEDSEDVKEIRGATVVVEAETTENILLPDWLTQEEAFGITRESTDEYYRTQFSAEPYRRELFPGVSTFERPPDYSYLYAELMYAFPRMEVVDDAVWQIEKTEGYKKAVQFLREHSTVDQQQTKALIQNVEKTILNTTERIQILLEGLIPRFDQVANVIERIKRKPVDLDKEIILWDQRFHTHLESGRPCLEKFSFSLRNDTIDVHVFVRTHDVGRAWFFNYYGIARLLGKIAKETGHKTGMITIESQSAHVYKRDWKAVEAFVKKQVSEKAPRMYFDPERDSDPRGIVNISVIENIIKAKLQDTTTGKLLFEIEGKTARELLYKLRHFKLISRVDHAAFIGSELAKAEICIKLGVPYKYDNPITLPNSEKIFS